MQAIDRRLVIQAAEVVSEDIRGVKQPNAEPFAAAVRLKDKRGVGEMPPGSLDEQFFAGDEDGARRADPGRFEGGVLAGLADLEVERLAAVDDAAPVPVEPSQHRSSQLGGVAVIPRM